MAFSSSKAVRLAPGNLGEESGGGVAMFIQGRDFLVFDGDGDLVQDGVEILTFVVESMTAAWKGVPVPSDLGQNVRDLGGDGGDGNDACDYRQWVHVRLAGPNVDHHVWRCKLDIDARQKAGSGVELL